MYSEHATSLPLYLGLTVVNPDPRIARNAHPPTSVLLALPLARVPYPDAVLAWNLVSLAAFALSLVIVSYALRLSAPVILAILAILPLCHPLFAHFYHCQLTLFLVLLVTGIWSLDRSDHPIGAGVLLGTAAAIKLFPAYLAVYYLARRQYRVVLTALLTFLGWSGLTVLVLGWQPYDDYIHRVVPGLGFFQGYGFNLSLAGLWHKLFNPVGDGGPVQPLWAAPGLARGVHSYQTSPSRSWWFFLPGGRGNRPSGT